MAINVKAKETELQRLINDAKTLHADLEGKRTRNESVDPTETEKLEKLIEDGKSKRKEIEGLKALDSMDQEYNVPGERKTADGAGDGAKAEQFTGKKSAGAQFVESAQFKALAERGEGKARMEVKAILGETVGSGGTLIRADRQPELVQIALQRPPSIINLVNHSQTRLNSVDYVRFTGRTDNAAIVAEGAAKPEGDLAFDVVTASVKVIAEWMKASRQILDDAPRLRGIIDNELTYMIELKLENVIIADMLAAAGIQSRVHATSGRAFNAADTMADTLRRALTDIRLEFYEADGIVLHPTQGEGLELSKDANGQYINVYDPVSQRVWRKPVVETQAMTSGTAVVGNFKLGYTVWDRMAAAVEVGHVNDDFIKNLVTILAELRAAYGVVRSKAIEKITGLP